MKSILVFVCCLALSLGCVVAEQGKQGKGKRAAQAKPQQQGHQFQGQRAGGGKHARRGQGSQGPTQFTTGGGGSGKAARRAQHHTTTSNQGNAGNVGNAAAGQGHAKIGGGGGRKAQVRQFNLNNSQHTNIKSVTFNANRRIVGAQNWRGTRYVVFRNYRPVWHDRIWWGAHFPRVVLIGGGWYYWNAGWWYPAWGYDPGANFYPYDGPIYGYNDLPPDQVVANVQQELVDEGYYHGEVDGLLGPLTRAALADYQRDHGLTTTAAIDEPTMESLGFS
jgi:Putative peptidoglycan binding domain